jgi:hypothetical protein
MHYDSTKPRRLLGIAPPTGPSRRSGQFAPRPAPRKGSVDADDGARSMCKRLDVATSQIASSLA